MEQNENRAITFVRTVLPGCQTIITGFSFRFRS